MAIKKKKNVYTLSHSTAMDMELQTSPIRFWPDEKIYGAPPQEEVEVYVQFVNTTNRTLDLYWIRNENMDNIQFTLKPKEEVRINTFNTHVWFFRDYYTGERMHVLSKNMFCPVRIRVPRSPIHPNDLCDVRSQVLIHFPMRKLKDICLWLIVRWLKRTVHSPRDNIKNYMIPRSLKDTLFHLLDTSTNYRNDSHNRRLRIYRRTRN